MKLSFWVGLAAPSRAPALRPVLTPFGVAPIRGRLPSWALLLLLYSLGDAFFVAPILDDTGRRDVVLPPGVTFYDWWDGSPRTGTLTSYDATDLARIPLFLREGALVPMEGELLWVPSTTASHFVLHEEDDSTTTLDATGNELTLARVVKATKLRVLTAAPTRVEVNGAMMAFTVAAPYVEVSLGVSSGLTLVRVIP